MPAISENNKRIVKNTSMLYVRMIIMLFVSLYTSRIILQILGVTDLGIYNVVGGVVSLLGFISSSMAIAVQRFLSFDIGRKNFSRLSETFSMSVLIHLLIAVLVLILAESVGPYFILYINLPVGRLEAAMWVFHFSILTSCVKIIQVPFNALIISYERMSIFAYLSIGEATLSLVCIFMLYWIDCDKLIIYAILMFFASVLIAIFYAFYCMHKIKEVKFKWSWDRFLFKRLINFAVWSALGEISWAGTIQGVNIVLNLFFGPVVNAARGIAYQVLGAVVRFTQSFQMAINPQIVKQYAAGNKEAMLKLVFRGTCFSFYLMLFLTLPILLRTEYILGLWLGEVPPYLMIFTQLVLVNALIDSLSNLLTTIAKAYGRIRNYQLAVSVILFMNLPLSYLFLKLHFPPESSFWIYGLLSALLLVVRLWFVKRMIQTNMTEFLQSVLLPIFLVSIVALPIPLFVHLYISPGLIGFISTSLLSWLCVSLAVYMVGLSSGERVLVKSRIQLFKQRIIK